jgi:hypothetical protein
MSENQVDDYTQVQAYRNEPFKICTKRDNLPNDGRPVTLHVRFARHPGNILCDRNGESGNGDH